MTRLDKDTSTTLEGRAQRPAVLLSMAVLTSLVFAANVWLYIHRAEGYAQRPQAYETAYLPRDQPVVRDLSWDGSALRAELGEEAAASHRVVAERPQAAMREGAHLMLRPTPGIERFELRAEGAPDAGPSVWTQHAGDAPPLFASPHVRVGAVKQYALRELVADLDDYAASHVAQAREVLERFGVTDGQPAEQRLEKLWLGLYAQLDPHRGVQRPQTRGMPTWVLYQRSLRGEEGLQCSGFADILTFFATVAGLPARTVDILREHRGIPLAAHTFVEIFDRLTGRWMYTDVNLGIFRITAGEGGAPLNAVQLAEAHRARIEHALWIERPQAGALVAEPYAKHAAIPSMFLNHNGIFVFQTNYRDRHAPLARLRRYVLPADPSYTLQPDLARHHVKVTALIMALLLGCYWVLVGARWLRARRPAA